MSKPAKQRSNDHRRRQRTPTLRPFAAMVAVYINGKELILQLDDPANFPGACEDAMRFINSGGTLAVVRDAPTTPPADAGPNSATAAH